MISKQNHEPVRLCKCQPFGRMRLRLVVTHRIGCSLEAVNDQELLEYMMASRPTQRSVELGDLLRRAREASGHTQKEAGRCTRKSQSWTHRVEAGTQDIQAGELRLLIELYKPDESFLGQLKRVSIANNGDDSQEASKNPAFVEMVRLAPQASNILLLQSERIATELQDDEYTILQYKAAERKESRDELLLEKRQRETVFTVSSPPPYNVILAQSSLERMPGGNSLLAQSQAGHLLRLQEQYPQLSIQVLPTKADLAYLDCDMTILKFAGKRQNMVYIPFGLDGCLLKKKWQVRERESYWTTVQRAALSKADSKDFLKKLAG